MAKESTAYNIPNVFLLDKMPDVGVLEDVLNELILRHEPLRTSFHFENNDVFQLIHPPQRTKLQVINLPGSQPSNDGLPKAILDEIHTPFDLGMSGLFRMKLFHSPNHFYLTIVFHHIIVDLHSKNIFARELSELYNAAVDRKPCDLPLLKVQYSDFSEWHNQWEKDAEAQNMRNSWKDEIPSPNTVINLPIDFNRPVVPSQVGKRILFGIENEMAKNIHDFATHHSSTVFITLLSAYALLLQKLSQQDHVVVGVPLSNRRNEAYQDTFGCFVNILPIVIDFDTHKTFTDIHSQVRKKLLLAHRKQEISYLDLMELGNDKRTSSSNPFFQAGFTFEPPISLHLNGLHSENLPIERKGAQLDLFMTLWEEKDHINGYFEYSTDVFHTSTINRYIECFLKILSQIKLEDTLLSQITILPESDREKFIQWNHTEYNVNTSLCLHQKFEEKAMLFPDQIAILTPQTKLSYKEFNSQANRLAHHLIALGVSIDHPVAVCMERSPELMIAIFAIHKAGGAYLPIDPKLPAERVEMMIDDANPDLIITKQAFVSNLKKYPNLVLADHLLDHPFTTHDSNPGLPVPSESLAYLMYTSGSTGKPKGVMIEHRSVINKIEWMQTHYPLDTSDTLLLKTPISFDASVWELFWWFFNGSRLALLTVDGEKDPQTIAEFVEEYKVTAIVFVPSVFSPMLEYIRSKSLINKFRSLRFIFQIGEALSPQLAEDINTLRTPTFSPLMVNTYGPTEATIAVSYYNCPVVNPIQKIYIGKPIFNTKLFVVDRDHLIQPIGVQGELVISGINLARGYLNRQELTQERFITMKGLNGEPLRVYKTGDLAKWTEEGEIDFIGRCDNQVKIRGYRIELGEIESKLLEHEGVKSAAVVMTQIGSDNQLAGYVVLKDHKSYQPDDIRSFLSSKLPDYMVPSFVMILEKMPLNNSGKTDRKALPRPQVQFSNQLVDATSTLEKDLIRIWKRILNIEAIGISNNFFDLGGNSLLAIRMVSEIRETMNVDIEPLAIMQYPNIKELAIYLSQLLSGQSNINRQPIPLRKRDFSKFRNKNN